MILNFDIEKQGNLYALFFNGKALKTAGGNELLIPTEEGASNLKQEAEQEKLKGGLYKLLSVHIDEVSNNRKKYVDELLGYLDNDLVCYLAPSPDDLVKQQKQQWRPIREYFEQKLMLELVTTEGLGHVVQPADVYNAIKEELNALDKKSFSLAYFSAKATKSVLLGLYFTLEEDETGESLHERASVEEIYYQNRYREDEEQEKVLNDRRKEINSLEIFRNFF